MKQVVICNPVRTAIGTYNGTLKGTPATELGAIAIKETLKRAGLDPAEVQSLIMGQVVQAGSKMNPARQAGMGGGLPVGVPALTVNRVCGSGAQAIASAALEVMAGQVNCAIAGGMENMDQAPYLVQNGRWATAWATRRCTTRCCATPERRLLGQACRLAHEDLVARTTSAARRRTAGRCARSSVSARRRRGQVRRGNRHRRDPGRKGPELFKKDEHNRADTTAESLAKLKPPSARTAPSPPATRPG